MRKLLCILALALAGTSAMAAEVKVAVASNFTAAMQESAAAFEAATGHGLVISYGSTGKIYAQIVNGAPFEVFLAADQARPQRLVEEGRASDRFTYAVGRLVLWSPDPDRVDAGGAVLRTGDFRRLAMQPDSLQGELQRRHGPVQTIRSSGHDAESRLGQQRLAGQLIRLAGTSPVFVRPYL